MSGDFQLFFLYIYINRNIRLKNLSGYLSLIKIMKN